MLTGHLIVGLLCLAGVSATAIASGYSHTCALVTGGGVKCWGYNLYAQLGIGPTALQWGIYIASPVDLDIGSGVILMLVFKRLLKYTAGGWLCVMAAGIGTGAVNAALPVRKFMGRNNEI
jgi:hypothetical protein